MPGNFARPTLVPFDKSIPPETRENLEMPAGPSRLVLHAWPPCATVGTAIEFRPERSPPSESPLPWVLRCGKERREVPSHLDAVAFVCVKKGTATAVAECDGQSAERAFVVVDRVEGELWHWLIESAKPRPAERLGRWETSIRERLGEAYDDELIRQRAKDRAIRAAVADAEQGAKWRNGRPIIRLPRHHREDVLQASIVQALRSGWRMPVPEAFGPWFHCIRVNQVIDRLRQGKTRPTVQEDPELPLSQTLADDGYPVERGELGFDALHSVATTFAAGLTPSPTLLRDAAHELLDAFGFDDGRFEVAMAFVKGLKGHSPTLLELHALVWGQEQHAEGLPDDDPARRLATHMAYLAKFQELRQRGATAQLPAGGLAERFAECLTIAEGGHERRTPWNPAATGEFFRPFAKRFPALEVLAPAWRLAEALAPDTDLARTLRASNATSHLDQKTRKQMAAFLAALDASTGGLELLSRWLRLATDREQQNRWYDEVAMADRKWWAKRTEDRER